MADQQEEVTSIEVTPDNGSFVVRMSADSFYQFLGQIATDKFVIQLGSKPKAKRGRPAKELPLIEGNGGGA